MQRKNWIDWAKALGILLVVMGHSRYAQEDIDPMIFMIHMPLFFVASGYLFKTQNKSLGEITKANVRTLLIPYLLFNLVWLLYLSSSSIIKSIIGLDAEWDSTVIWPLLYTLEGVPGNLLCGTTWFLLALIWCKYIIYGIEKSRKPWNYIIIVSWIIALVLVQICQPVSPLAFNAGIAGCLWFGVGYYIRKYSDRFHFPKWIWVPIIPVTFFICLYICRYQGNCNYLCGDLKGWLGLLGTASGLLCFYGVCNLLDGVHSKLVVRISSASIAIMCLHMLIMPNLEKLTHYQHHLFITFLGDFAIVLLLTAIYPLLQKYVPLLVGNRK